MAILTVFRESNATNFESQSTQMKDSPYTAVGVRLADLAGTLNVNVDDLTP